MELPPVNALGSVFAVDITVPAWFSFGSLDPGFMQCILCHGKHIAAGSKMDLRR